MKKTLSVLLIILILVGVFSVPALAENTEIDLSGLSLEELIGLYDQVRVELSNRIGLESDSFIGRGEFVVGVDIKAGFYDLECIETYYDALSDGLRPWNDLFVYDIDGNQRIRSSEISIGGHVTVRLEPGETLEIEECTFRISEVQAFWAP